MWAGLVADTPPASQLEVEKLNALLTHYEAENLRLKNENHLKDLAIKANLDRIADHEKKRQVLAKQVNQLESALKFEKIACEGLTKKAGILDLDLSNITEERRILIEDQIFNRKRVKDLESTLNDDRSKRLQDMHENELLKKENLDLETRASRAEGDILKLRSGHLEKLQLLETSKVWRSTCPMWNNP